MLSRGKTIVKNLETKKGLISGKQALIRDYATKTPFKFKKPKGSQATQDLAADGTGKHTHFFKEICKKAECETKTCPSLCDNLEGIETLGHFTHKPVVGKFSKHISDYDGNNSKKDQYYTKNCDKNKKVTGQKATQFKTKKEIEIDLKIQNLLQKSEIANKFKN